MGFATLILPEPGSGEPIVNLIGNLELDVATILSFAGIHRFLGCSRALLWPIFPAAAVSLGKVLIFATHGLYLPLNVILGSLDRTILSIAGATLLLRCAEAELRPASWAAAAAQLLWTGLLLVRMGWEILIVLPSDSVKAGSLHEPTTAIMLWARLSVTFSLTIAFLWMVGRRLEAKLTRLATIDALTGVPNRRLLWEKGARLVARADQRGEPLGVLVIDIDHFKSVNDKWGHGMGDAVLVRVAETIAGAIRAIDILGRFGGEEFVAVLPASPHETALAIGERIRSAVAAMEVKTGDLSLKCTVSIGCADLVKGKSWEQLVDEADQALYRAKNGGRNQVVSHSAGSSR